MPLTMMLDNKMKLMMKKRMKKVLGRMFFGCGVAGMLAFGGCGEDEKRDVLIEEEKHVMTFGAEGGSDTIRVAHDAVVDAFSGGYEYVRYPDTVYMWGGKRIMIGDWYRVVRNEEGDLLLVQVNSNKSVKQRTLILSAFTLEHCDRIQITQEGMKKSTE